MTSATEQLEQSKSKLALANTRRIRVQVQLESGRQQLADARRDADAAYGTSDVAKLKALLLQQEEHNAQALHTFTKAVQDFDVFVSKIEAALADPQAMATLLAALPEAEPDAEEDI